MSTKLEFDSLEEGLERVSKKHKATLPKTLKSIDAMIAELNSCKQKLTSGNIYSNKYKNIMPLLLHFPTFMLIKSIFLDTEMETDEYVRDNLVALHKSLSPNKIANDYKELHAPISKLGKSVDKVLLIFSPLSSSLLYLLLFSFPPPLQELYIFYL